MPAHELQLATATATGRRDLGAFAARRRRSRASRRLTRRRSDRRVLTLVAVRIVAIERVDRRLVAHGESPRRRRPCVRVPTPSRACVRARRATCRASAATPAATPRVPPPPRRAPRAAGALRRISRACWVGWMSRRRSSRARRRRARAFAVSRSRVEGDAARAFRSRASIASTCARARRARVDARC